MSFAESFVSFAEKSGILAQMFREECGDSSLQLSTVISLPCEASTEYPYYIFLQNYHFFLQMTTFFSKTDGMFHRILRPMDGTPDRTYPILETFLYLITTRRFGGVGAQEGLEIAPDILIQHFSPN